MRGTADGQGARSCKVKDAPQRGDSGARRAALDRRCVAEMCLGAMGGDYWLDYRVRFFERCSFGMFSVRSFWRAVCGCSTGCSTGQFASW